jgi:predicted dehydrogenase
VNFLVIGLGSAGQRHLRVLQSKAGPSDSVFAYRGTHKRGLISADLRSEDFNIDPINAYGANEITLLEEISTITWDLAIIATPPSSHLQYFEKIAGNSERILIEKPIAIDLCAALRIQELTIQSKKPLFVAYQLSFHQIVKLISEWIGKIGEIKKCQSQFSEFMNNMNPFRSMNSHHLSSPDGGGVFMALSHDIDLIFLVLDVTEFKNCDFRNVILNDQNALIECALNAEIIKDGKAIVLESFFSLMEGPSVRNCVILGDLGSIEWNLITGKFCVLDNNRTVIFEQNLSFEKDQMFLQEIEFLLSIKEMDDVCLNNLKRSISIANMNDILCNRF